MNYRNKKLTQSAQHEKCVSCGADDGTIVWAHSNSQKHGKGMGIKAHDLFGAYLCHQCHHEFDNGGKFVNIKSESGELILDKDYWFHNQWERSIIIACKKGYL